MKILLLGNTGQLGWELNRTLLPLGEVQAVGLPEVNLKDIDSLRALVRNAKADVIVNATAYTAVDRAESDQELAFAINAVGPGILAEEAKKLGAVLIHYSTDYVFDGTKGTQYLETDQVNPLNIYGKSKLAGEQAIQAVDGEYLIFRTAWVYSLRRDSFVTKVLQWARHNKTLRLVNDQVSNPTWARLLAETTTLVLARAGSKFPLRLAERSAKGLYHLAGDGVVNRLEWAEAILRYDPDREGQLTTEIQPALTSEFPTPAQRPLFSGLNCDKFFTTFRLRLPPWETALRLAMQSPR